MPSMMRKAMIYLGMVEDEDEYDEDDQYDAYVDDDEVEEEGPIVRARNDLRAPPAGDPDLRPGGGVRTITVRQEESPPTPRSAQPHRGAARPVARPAPRASVAQSPMLRPVPPERSARPFVVAPSKYGDAQEIGDRLKLEQPVIVNLQAVNRDLARRMIDFGSGLTYALGGTMEKVADQVFLLTPSNVEVSQEERQRLQRHGLFRS